MTTWQESWLDASVGSYRPGMGCQDVWWAEALEIEHALLTGRPLCGFGLDWAKCFDSIPKSIVLSIARKAGMPEGIVCAVQGMMEQLQRRFRLGPLIGGAGFASANGILQGCP